MHIHVHNLAVSLFSFHFGSFRLWPSCLASSRCHIHLPLPCTLSLVGCLVLSQLRHIFFYLPIYSLLVFELTYSGSGPLFTSPPFATRPASSNLLLLLRSLILRCPAILPRPLWTPDYPHCMSVFKRTHLFRPAAAFAALSKSHYDCETISTENILYVASNGFSFDRFRYYTHRAREREREKYVS